MYASVQVGGRNYGGYIFTKANISVQYENVSRAWRLGHEREYLRAFMVEEWVGRRYDFSIRVKKMVQPGNLMTESDLAAAGTTITEDVAIKMGDDLLAISPEQVRWQVEREFEEWWIGKGRHRYINSPAGPMVKVNITDLDLNAQQGGEIQLTPEAAEWLGMQLLKFARGQGSLDGHVDLRLPCSRSNLSVAPGDGHAGLTLVQP